MPLDETTIDDLARQVSRLGVAKGADLLIHSRLISFGRIVGGAAAVYDVLRQAVGPGGTIAVPTYTLTLPEDEVYDRLATPSRGMGVFAEYVRGLPGAVRSRCPLHNHAAVGPKAAILEATTGEVSLGPGSDFEAFFDNEFAMLFLGCRLSDAATYTMHAETLAGVPYRKWMDLKRRVRDDSGRVETVVCRYFGRGAPGGDLDLTGVEAAMIGRGIVTVVPCAYGVSHFVTIADYHPAIMEMLADNPLVAMPKSRQADG